MRELADVIARQKCPVSSKARMSGFHVCQTKIEMSYFHASTSSNSSFCL